MTDQDARRIAGVMTSVRAAAAGLIVAAVTISGVTLHRASPGYSRARFGSEPTASTRTRVKTREAIDGHLTDFYTGAVLDADPVQIDHLVSLHDAWDSGANHWSTARRKAFAGDRDPKTGVPMVSAPFNLVVTTAHLNESKSDQRPSQWSPIDRGHACLYGRRYLAVKARWNLRVDPADRAAVDLACG